MEDDGEWREKSWWNFEKNIFQPVYQTVHGEARQLSRQLENVVVTCIRVANKRLRMKETDSQQPPAYKNYLLWFGEQTKAFK